MKKFFYDYRWNFVFILLSLFFFIGSLGVLSQDPFFSSSGSMTEGQLHLLFLGGVSVNVVWFFAFFISECFRVLIRGRRFWKSFRKAGSH